MIAAIPTIEVADDRDPTRAGRPHGKRDARHAVYRAQVSAELVVDPMLIALVEEVEVLLSQGRQERVGIMPLPRLPVILGHTQLVGKHFAAARNEALVESFGSEGLHRPDLARGRINHRACHAVTDERPDHHASRAPDAMGVHAQLIVRPIGRRIQEALERGRWQDHGKRSKTLTRSPAVRLA